MDAIATRRFAAKRDVFRSAERRFAAKRVVFSATRSGKRAFRDSFGRTPSENNAFRGALATGLWLYVAFRGVLWLPRPPRATDTGPDQRQQRHELARQASNRPAAACQPGRPVRVRVLAKWLRLFYFQISNFVAPETKSSKSFAIEFGQITLGSDQR